MKTHKRHVMMASISEKSIKKDTPMQPESEANFNKMAQRVQDLFKSQHFYDQMDFIQNKGWS